MKILVGTSNPAKLDRYKTILRQLSDVEVLAPKDVQITVSVVEDGITAEENARKKARAYASASGLPALSVDEALYIDGLPPEGQPGVRVRRYNGNDATDEELLMIYLEKIKPLPSHDRGARWTYAICLALPYGQEFVEQVQLAVNFIDTPVLPLLPGYPLHSILMDGALRKALRNLTPEEEQQRMRPVYDAVNKLVRNADLITPLI
jgi:XTP/dITP diphosphohydrolase